MTSSQVNYLARCGNFVEKGLAYKGTLRTRKSFSDMIICGSMSVSRAALTAS